LEALNQGEAAKAARRRARGARTAGYLGAASAALSAGSSYSGMKARRPAPAARRPTTPKKGSGAVARQVLP
jgi:hypothetical protein